MLVANCCSCVGPKIKGLIDRQNTGLSVVPLIVWKNHQVEVNLVVVLVRQFAFGNWLYSGREHVRPMYDQLSPCGGCGTSSSVAFVEMEVGTFVHESITQG